VIDPETAVRAHARRVVAGDPRAVEDIAPGARLEPADLLDRLLGGGFQDFELVAHARIGAYHFFKTKYVGSTTIVVQARWTRTADEGWRIQEAEVARVMTGDAA